VAENGVTGSVAGVRDRRVGWIGQFTFSGYTQSTVTKVTETRRARTVIVRYRYRYIDRRGVVIKAAFTGSAESPRRHNNELEYNSSASTTSVEYVVGVRTCWVGGRAREERRLGEI
jgi:hypothetical protein